ncbi:MAG: hypothetical protein HY568_05700 [Candidatus Latescibacteria bacterium]|nr:hypothetical protein [Candidatus Latescibacterota bacterium]
MLTNASEPAGKAKLEEELRANPPFRRVIELLEEDAQPFAIDPAAGGLEIVPLNEVKQAPNRCRMKLFKPREAKERLCAFFFKRSNLEFSRDRFSYGAVEFRPEQLSDEDVRTWIGWLVSGLDPDRRPERLRRAFLYTIPE